ncbi:MAG: T9SS type A sorting domain-containing protein [Bacteroidetes bacterium]|nr:T9SS type A sorting domain-containing protein [Bacteroidota bacterium]
MRKLTLITGLLMAMQTGFAQWTQVEGPPVGKVEVITELNDGLYAAGNGFLFKSDFTGSSWVNITGEIPAYTGVRKVIRYNGLLFAATNRGIYRQDEAGHWQEISTGLPKSGFYSTGATGIFQSGDSLYSITNQGIFHWNPSGSKWTTKSTSLFARKTSKYIYDGLILKQKILLAMDSVMVSDDLGATWSAATGFENEVPQVFGYSRDTLFAAGNKMYRSVDGGLTWTSFSDGFPGMDKRFVAVENGRLFYYRDGSLYTTTSESGIWTKTDSDMRFIGSPRTMFKTGGKLFAGWDVSGLYVSEDQGKTWKKSGKGLQNLAPKRHFDLNGKIVLEYGDFNYYLSGDQGNSWELVPTPGSLSGDIFSAKRAFKDLFFWQDTLFAIASGDLYQSVNWGQDWKYLNGNNLSSLVCTDSAWFATGGDGPEVSYNRGRTWTVRNTGVGNTNGFKLIGVNGLLVAGTSNAGVYFSSDGGRNWVWANKGFKFPNGSYLSSICYFDGYFYICNQGSAGAPVLRSKDLTQNWEGFSSGLGTNNSGNQVYGSGNSLFFTGYSDGFAFIGGPKTTWVKAGGSIPGTTRQLSFVLGREVWIGVEGTGLWKIDGSLLEDVRVSVESKEGVPAMPVLVSAYPNPFNPEATIRIDLPAPDRISVAIYSLTGQLIRALAHQEVKGAGVHQFQFSGDGFASGVYLYRVTGGKFQTGGKLVLLK